MRFLLALGLFITCTYAANFTKTVIDFCSLDRQDCAGGVCEKKHGGNRCKCLDGFMGRNCQRLCQDVYKSCKRWKEEKRCSWARPISPFFHDNCAYSCGICRSNEKKLALALPPILDNLAWIVGRWETKTLAGDRFPENLSGPYREVLEIQVADVPAFDRPPLNVSSFAETVDGQDIHVNYGFLTTKPFHEDTGFVEINKPKDGEDLVAIESVSNTGLMWIEEGIVRGHTIKLEAKMKKSMVGWWKEFKSAKRLFMLIGKDHLEERVVVNDAEGATRKWLKRYRRTFDYMKNLVPFDQEDSIL